MKGFVEDIEDLTEENKDYRRVLYTGKHLQLVLMSLEPGEEIGEEVHKDADQFFRVEKGKGEVWIDGKRNKDQGRRCNRGSRRGQAQRGQYRAQAAEAIYTLQPTPSSRRLESRDEGRGRRVQRALRRQDDRVTINVTARVVGLPKSTAGSGRVVADHGQPFGTALNPRVDNASGRADDVKPPSS